MRRRRLLGTAAGALAGALGGCTASAFPSPGPGRGSPTPTAVPLDTCPAVLPADRTACPAGDGGPLAVERSARRVRGSDWSLLVTVTNRSADAYGTNPYAWSVFRRADDGWTRVAPEAYVEPWTDLAPGEAYAWQLSAGDAPAVDADQRVFLDLEPGRHAFAVALRGPDRVAVVVPFDVQA